MIAKQLSVYVENKPGKLIQKIKTLADKNIDIRAMYIAESEEFGVLRMIVSDPEAAKDALSADSLVKITSVIAVGISDEAGALSGILSVLSEEGVNVEYMYAYAVPDKGAIAVFRVNDCEETERILEARGIV